LQLAFRIFYKVLPRKKALENLIPHMMKSLAVLLQVLGIESAEGPAQAVVAARILACDGEKWEAQALTLTRKRNS